MDNQERIYLLNNYLSILDGTDSKHHRSPIIIHVDGYYFAEFQTMEQLNFFAETLGFSYELVEVRKWANTEMDYKIYKYSHKIISVSFWKLSDLPPGAKPIKAVSNGYLVTCYFVNDGETITIYRPNPNAKEIYKPLELKEHIAHNRIYGMY